MPRKFKTVFIDSLLWLQVNTDASLTRIANSASPWASKVCGNQWSLPIINPSTIVQNQRLLVGFPNLGAHDVIVLGTARLAFKITLNSDDANWTVVQNLGRVIVKPQLKFLATVMSATVTMISGRQQKRGRTPSTKALTSLIPETKLESDLVLEIRIHLLQQTRPLPMLIAIDSTSHWISICLRATCRSIRARSGTAWSMNSPSVTTAWSGPRVLQTPLTTSRTSAWSTTWWPSQSWPDD